MHKWFLLSIISITSIMLLIACGPTKYTLDVSVNPISSGTVAPLHERYEEGTSVYISATPSTNFRFSHWSGDVSGDRRFTSVVMDNNKNITANFILQYRVTILVNPSDGGSVVPYVNTLYDAGSTIELKAVPAHGYIFDHWSGDIDSRSNVVTVFVDGDKTATATFLKIFFPTINDGIGIPQAADYKGSKHPLIIIDSDGYEYRWADKLPDDLFSTSLEETQLIAFIGKEQCTVIETCKYHVVNPTPRTIYFLPRNNEVIVEREQCNQDIVIREAKTGDIVAQTTLTATSRRCNQVEEFPLLSLSNQKFHANISNKQIGDWLRNYVIP